MAVLASWLASDAALPSTYTVPAGTVSVTVTVSAGAAVPSEATAVFVHVTV